ncbi:MAG: hypothetical protein QM820_22750 [Minicystis sp.]
MKARFSLAAACAAPLLFLAAPALAQDVAAAEALFNKGIAEMDAGRFDTACPALAESQRLDPRPGTLFAQADCNAKAGKIATAIALYEDYQRTIAGQPPAVKTKHADRLKIARAQIDKLRPSVPTLTLILPASAPRDARVRRDGTELSAAALGLELPVDPGEHVVTLDAPGRRTAEQRFTVERGQKKVVELTLGGAASAGEPATPASSTTAPAPVAGAKPGQAQRISAFVVGGVGAASLLVGAVTGGLTLAKKSTIDKNCVGTTCNHEGKVAADSAKTTGLVSTIGFAVGAAGLVTGTVLLLTAPKKTDEKAARYDVEIGPSGVAVNVKGVW